jgi:hypothetical protein
MQAISAELFKLFGKELLKSFQITKTPYLERIIFNLEGQAKGLLRFKIYSFLYNARNKLN